MEETSSTDGETHHTSDFKWPAIDRRVSMEMTFANVDPSVMALLTGVNPETGERPVDQSLTVTGVHPAKRRTFWEWLRRRPKYQPQPYTYFFPHVKIAPPE